MRGGGKKLTLKAPGAGQGAEIEIEIELLNDTIYTESHYTYIKVVAVTENDQTNINEHLVNEELSWTPNNPEISGGNSKYIYPIGIIQTITGEKHDGKQIYKYIIPTCIEPDQSNQIHKLSCGKAYYTDYINNVFK
jgi:hypothetical protein